MHKTRLIQNMKAKHTSNVQKQKHEGKRENKQQNHLEPLSFHALEEPFRLTNNWSGGEGRRIETIQVRKEHESFEKISKRSKKWWKLILVSRWDHIVALLSG